MTNFQIGAQMYSVRNHCQNADEMLLTMKALKAMGYNTCQLSGQNRAIPAEQLRDMLDESGLTCACTHISFQEMEEDLDKVIRFHKTLGCEYPGIGGLPGEYRSTPEGFVEFAKKAKDVREFGEKKKAQKAKYEKLVKDAISGTKYASLMESADPRVVQEAKNSMADLKWTAAEF